MKVPFNLFDKVLGSIFQNPSPKPEPPKPEPQKPEPPKPEPLKPVPLKPVPPKPEECTCYEYNEGGCHDYFEGKGEEFYDSFVSSCPSSMAPDYY